MTNVKGIDTLGRRMSNDLPLHFDPVLFAKQGRRVSGYIATHALPRIEDSTAGSDNRITVNMSFSTSSLQFPMVQGTIVGSVVQTCQRCLGDVVVEFNIQLTLLLANPDSVDMASKEGYEIFEYSGPSVSTIELIEDEILLAIPIVVKHATVEECDPDARKWLETETIEFVEKDRPSPFAKLKDLKTQLPEK